MEEYWGRVDSAESTMDYLTFILSVSFVWTSISVILKFCRAAGRKTRPARLPPGPPGFPIIGNILSLGEQPHRSLGNLSKTYGPVMSLKLGSVTAIVISSSEAAKEVLSRNDQAFAARMVPEAVKVGNYPENSMVWLSAFGHWRMLRKICTMEMLSVQQIEASRGVRRKVVDELLSHVEECRRRGRAVDIAGAAFTAALNLISNVIFSCDLAHHDSNFSEEFKNSVWGVLGGLGKSNLADYFKAFRFMDLQGRRREIKTHFDKMIHVFDGIINQRLESEAANHNSSSSARRDVLDALLSLKKENGNQLMSSSDIKHLLLDLFIAGTETNSSVVEWGMAELLHNPEKMAKAQKEIRGVLGNDGIVQESDISKFPYFQSTVKEIFRMHPPAPLLVSHKTVSDVELCGFTIPKNSQVLVNAWAIGRDPTTWLNPNEFMPERFLGCEIDVKGRDFELIPFGAGRRMCPGLPLAHRMVHFMLATLIHSHDWKLEDSVEPENIDMSEKFGLTLQKAQPLRAIPIKV